MKAITTKFHGATNVRGSRVSASDSDGNRIVLSWDHALNADENHRAAADALCTKMKWTGRRVMGSLKHGYVHVFVEPEETTYLAIVGAVEDDLTLSQLQDLEAIVSANLRVMIEEYRANGCEVSEVAEVAQ